MSLNTLNYSERNGAFMSFISYTPKWYLDFKDRYYSFDSSNKLRLHNSNTEYNNLDGTIKRSVINPVVNNDYQMTKVFDNVFFSANFKDSDNFSSIKFNTDHQESSIVSKANIDNRESTYKFYIPRKNSTELFQDRMKGKYIIGNYIFISENGNPFTLPLLETTYRYSMI